MNEFFADPTFRWMYIISNITGVLFLILAYKFPRTARILFALLFGWACWINMKTAFYNPQDYLSYSTWAIRPYKNFIEGWFSQHVQLLVPIIAVGQGLIAIGMLLNNKFARLACIGSIIFLLSIAPLGLGAAFPFSLTVSWAAFVLLQKLKNGDSLFNRSVKPLAG